MLSGYIMGYSGVPFKELGCLGSTVRGMGLGN